WGMIYKAVDDEIVLDEALMLAARLAHGPKALTLTRRLFWESTYHSFEEQLQREQIAQRAAGKTQDFREGLAAFFEKRDPRFKGE
ncbi:MAG TPA: enoyl-CoA hydratase-related protein, partial [Rhizomicrobium sp.]